MKKAYLIALAIIVLLLGFVYVRLFTAQAVFHGSIEVEIGAFVLENINKADIKIIIAKTNTITVDLNGPQKDLDKIRFYKKNNGVTKFTLSEEWLELTGTITVPEGTFLDVRMSDESNVQVNVPEESQSFEGMNSFIIDTEFVNSVNISDGDISIDGWDDILVIDTDGWDLGDESGGEGEGEDNESENCSVGSQIVRNYCCERFNENELTPECSGDGGWVFNNVTRECEYFCESEESGEDEEEPANCSIGSQPTRNQCCDNQNEDTDRPDCIGEWRFNNVTRECEFYCYTAEELEEYYGGGGDGDMDETSMLCSDFETQEDKDECCDYNLKTPLSLGAKPGFPDCIGRWYFDSEEGCQFDCANYIEMIEILQEVRNAGE